MITETVGIIPAHAGNTYSHWPVSQSFWDHPRACGEHRSAADVGQVRPGSSPRMRGTPRPRRRPRSRWWIIPAHAGNTIWQGREPRLRGDHPRACGEHQQVFGNVRPIRGSSPRMRGTPDDVQGTAPDTGIIPAHAGNTDTVLMLVCGRRDHPRACGEHSNAIKAWAAQTGSSPRMRGTPCFHGVFHFVPGIIPAHAGNT